MLYTHPFLLLEVPALIASVYPVIYLCAQTATKYVLPHSSLVPGHPTRILFFTIYAVFIMCMFVFADPSVRPRILYPNEDATPLPRIVVGGSSNRWLNITRTYFIRGAEDPDSRIFMCEVCLNRSTPLEQCETLNYTLLMVGAPPKLTSISSKIPN